jgi:hypothetical protein
MPNVIIMYPNGIIKHGEYHVRLCEQCTMVFETSSRIKSTDSSTFFFQDCARAHFVLRQRRGRFLHII